MQDGPARSGISPATPSMPCAGSSGASRARFWPGWVPRLDPTAMRLARRWPSGRKQSSQAPEMCAHRGMGTRSSCWTSGAAMLPISSTPACRASASSWRVSTPSKRLSGSSHTRATSPRAASSRWRCCERKFATATLSLSCIVKAVGERDLDVVVFGATGVTGRRVAAYLAEGAAETGARWAAAGRDADKVKRVLAEVGVNEAQIIAADVDDPASLRAMAARTRVVLNLVGPYTLYGWPVIEACVAGGAHYADLTGEIPFVRRVIGAFEERAVQAQVKLVQVCGFECLPPDLAVLLAAETARERWGEGLASAELEVSMRQPPGIPRLSD